jgi:hypothetical protein
MTIRAAERVEVSSHAANLVTRSVTPEYPALARQMQVTGTDAPKRQAAKTTIQMVPWMIFVLTSIILRSARP